MADDALICPDCGGVVGATQRTDAGEPCRCFAPVHSGPADTDMIPSPEPPPGTPRVEKLCRICGRNVAGQPRFKDVLGYICYDCNKAEERKLHGDRVRCGSCGRHVKESLLENYEGSRICPRCVHERKELAKQRIEHLGIKSTHQRYEKMQLTILGAVAGVLLLIILLARLHLL